MLHGIERYLRLAIVSQCFDSIDIAVDFQIKQRILPKIRGLDSEQLRDCLDQLSVLLNERQYKQSAEKLASMKRQLGRGYVNYWETH